MDSARQRYKQSQPTRDYAPAGDAVRPFRFALLNPHNGGNFGDASIQDAVIANLKLRLPNSEFYGVCLNCRNFVEQHGVGAFPLVARNIPWYSVLVARPSGAAGVGESAVTIEYGRVKNIAGILRRTPVLRTVSDVVNIVRREARHCVAAYKFIKTQDVVVVSGGGQLNEEWGGFWGQPFALFKWAMLARITNVPYLVLSVGAGQLKSKPARVFASLALRLASYRSYRDRNSREFATRLLYKAAQLDPIVPDLAFSLPSRNLPSPRGIRLLSKGRPILALSPIAYAKPRRWIFEDDSLYSRYVTEMARVISTAIKRDYLIVFVCSSLGDDESVIPDILERLDAPSKLKVEEQIHMPKLTTWKDLVAILQEADLLVASRLHSAILGFISGTAVVAISSDPKVDWLMKDLGQSDYLLQIRHFTAEQVFTALDNLRERREAVLNEIGSYRRKIAPTLDAQYELITKMVGLVSFG